MSFRVKFLFLATFAACATPSSPHPGETATGGPPQAAIDACQGLSNYSACSMEKAGRELRGTCRHLDTPTLTCVPSAPSASGAG